MTVTNRSGGLSRGTFLRGSAIATTGTSLVEATSAFVKQAEADSASPVVGPDATPITLNINGVARTLDVASNMTLAEVLRGPLGLTGTKIACDRGSCSACAVWLDGAAVNSCILLAIADGDRTVTTIEGATSFPCSELSFGVHCCTRRAKPSWDGHVRHESLINNL